jgi:GMP synthase-like glutamine amidotransferase
MQVDEEHRHPWLGEVFAVLGQALARGLPTLGVCLGAQALARVAGADVGPAPRAEWGWEHVELTADGASDALFAGLPPVVEVFQWHSYRFTLPPGAVALATSPVGLQAFRIGDAAWGVQWHPEITAETALLWAERYPPSPGGVPVDVDTAALRAQIARRMDGTNADGRALCARFLDAAAQRRPVAA